MSRISGFLSYVMCTIVFVSTATAQDLSTNPKERNEAYQYFENIDSLTSSFRGKIEYSNYVISAQSNGTLDDLKNLIANAAQIGSSRDDNDIQILNQINQFSGSPPLEVQIAEANEFFKYVSRPSDDREEVYLYQPSDSVYYYHQKSSGHSQLDISSEKQDDWFGSDKYGISFSFLDKNNLSYKKIDDKKLVVEGSGERHTYSIHDVVITQRTIQDMSNLSHHVTTWYLGSHKINGVAVPRTTVSIEEGPDGVWIETFTIVEAEINPELSPEEMELGPIRPGTIVVDHRETPKKVGYYIADPHFLSSHPQKMMELLSDPEQSIAYEEIHWHNPEDEDCLGCGQAKKASNTSHILSDADSAELSNKWYIVGGLGALCAIVFICGLIVRRNHAQQ